MVADDGGPGAVAYDLTKGRKASPLLFWLLIAVVILGVAGVIYATVFRERRPLRSGNGFADGRLQGFDALGIRLAVPPGSDTTAEGGGLEILVHAEPGAPNGSSTVVTVVREEGAGAAQLAATYHEDQSPGWKEAGVFSLYRHRILRPGDPVVVHEILSGPRPSLLGSVPDNARGPVAHRLYADSGDGRVVRISWEIPAQAPEALEDRLETMVSSLHFSR